MKTGLPALLAAVCVAQLMLPAFGQAINRHFISNGFRPVIASDANGGLHVAFEAYGRGKEVTDIYYTESRDQGAHWSAPHNLSETLGISQHAEIALEKNGAIDVVWTDINEETNSPDIFFTRSANGGHSWSKPIDISVTPGASLEPVLATGPDNSINVIWSDTSVSDKSKQILYSYCTDGGKTWTSPIAISNTRGSSTQPTIAAPADGLIYAAWADTTPGEKHPDIFCCQCQHGLWTKAFNVTHSPSVSAQPSIASSNGKVFLCWTDNSQNESSKEIRLAVGSSAAKFETVLNLSPAPGQSAEPCVTTRADDLAVVWTERRADGHPHDIRAIASANNGELFSSVIDISNSRVNCKNPHATISSGKIYTVWEEVNEKGESTLNIGSTDLTGRESGKPLPVDGNHQGAGGKKQ